MYLGKGVMLRLEMLDDDRTGEVYLTEEERDAVGRALGLYTREQVGEYQAREAELISAPLRRQVADLQRQLAETTGQVEVAQQAAREIMAERNTWARQLADMRDERNTAREETEKAREMMSIVSTDRDNLHVEMGELAERLVTEWPGETRRHSGDYRDGMENAANELRRALARWLTT